MNKIGVEMAWYYILAFIILLALFIWAVFFIRSSEAGVSGAIQRILGF